MTKHTSQQERHHNTTERHMQHMKTQHGSNTTRQQPNMVAAQNIVQTLLGTDNSTKGHINESSTVEVVRFCRINDGWVLEK